MGDKTPYYDSDIPMHQFKFFLTTSLQQVQSCQRTKYRISKVGHAIAMRTTSIKSLKQVYLHTKIEVHYVKSTKFVLQN